MEDPRTSNAIKHMRTQKQCRNKWGNLHRDAKMSVVNYTKQPTFCGKGGAMESNSMYHKQIFTSLLYMGLLTVIKII